MSAFAMAVWFRGMDAKETARLTHAMCNSGDTVDLSLFGDKTVDKHSTGGVGDKTDVYKRQCFTRIFSVWTLSLSA